MAKRRLTRRFQHPSSLGNASRASDQKLCVQPNTAPSSLAFGGRSVRVPICTFHCIDLHNELRPLLRWTSVMSESRA